MRKFLLVLLALASICFAEVRNANFVWDTVTVDSIIGNGDLDYSAALQLEDGQPMRVVMLTADTSNAGYGGFNGDSLDFKWGYQTGSRCFDSSITTLDTCWDIRIEVGTVDADSLGVVNTGSQSTAGVITRQNGGVDTLIVAGWAMQSRLIVPEQDDFIRFYAEGVTGNNGDAVNPTFFLLRRRLYEPSGKPKR